MRSRPMYYQSWDPVKQDWGFGPPIRPNSAAGCLEASSSSAEKFPAPKARLSKSMVADDKYKIPKVERDFVYESEQIDVRFMILEYDVDRFLNVVPPEQRGEEWETLIELRNFTSDLTERLREWAKLAKEMKVENQRNAALVAKYQKRQAKMLDDIMTRPHLKWNSEKRRAEPEGATEDELGSSPSKCKIAKLHERIENLKKILTPVINCDEEEGEDADADAKAVAKRTARSKSKKTQPRNDDNDVTDKQVAISSESIQTCTSESTQTDTGRKFSRSTQTRKNRDDSAKVMACLMLSTVNDIMSAVIKTFRGKSFRELPELYDRLEERLTQLEEDVRFYGFPIDKAFEAAKVAQNAAAYRASQTGDSQLLRETARLIDQGIIPPGQSDDEDDVVEEEMPVPTFPSSNPPLPVPTSTSSSPPLPGVAKLLAQGINPADEYKEEVVKDETKTKSSDVKPKAAPEKPKVAAQKKAEAQSATTADGRSLEDLVPGRDDALIRELLQKEAAAHEEAKPRSRPVTAKPQGANKRLVVKMQKPKKPAERPIPETLREEPEETDDVPPPRFVSSSPPLPTVAKMIAQGINPADDYNEKEAEKIKRKEASSPPLPGVAKLLAQGINPADEYKDEADGTKKATDAGDVTKPKPKHVPHPPNTPKPQYVPHPPNTPKPKRNLDFSKLQPGKDDELIRQILQEEAEAKAAAARAAKEKAKAEGKEEDDDIVTGKPPIHPGKRTLKIRMTKRLNTAIAQRPPREPKSKSLRRFHVETMPHRLGQDKRNDYLQEDEMSEPIKKYPVRKPEKSRKYKQKLNMIEEDYEEPEEITPYFEETRRPFRNFEEPMMAIEENEFEGRVDNTRDYDDFEESTPSYDVREPMMATNNRKFNEMVPDSGYFEDAPNYPEEGDYFPEERDEDYDRYVKKDFQKAKKIDDSARIKKPAIKSKNADVRPKEPKNTKSSKRAPVKAEIEPSKMIPNIRNNKYDEDFARDEERPRIPAAIPREEDLQLPKFVSTSPPVPAATKRVASIENEEIAAPSFEEQEEVEGATAAAVEPKEEIIYQQKEDAKEMAKPAETEKVSSKPNAEASDKKNEEEKEKAKEAKTENLSLALTKTFAEMVSSLQDEDTDVTIKIESSRRKKLEPMSKPIPYSVLKPDVRSDNKSIWSKIPVLSPRPSPKTTPRPDTSKSAAEKGGNVAGSKIPVATKSAAESRTRFPALLTSMVGKETKTLKPIAPKPAPQQSRVSLPPVPTSMVGQQPIPEWTTSPKLPEFKSTKRLPDFNFSKLPGKKYTYDAKSKISSRRSKDGFLPPIRK